MTSLNGVCEINSQTPFFLTFKGVEHIVKQEKGCVVLSNIPYFALAHTAEGQLNYLQSNLQGIKHIYVLNNISSIVNTAILREIIGRINKDGELEIIKNSYNSSHIDGLIIRSQSTAFLSKLCVLEDNDNLKYINCSIEKNDHEKIKELNSKRKSHAVLAHQYFKEALSIHDKLEGIYIDKMDFKKANIATQYFIDNIFKGIKRRQGESIVYKRFFGTNTAYGSVNNVEALIKDIKNRVYIKGRAGTGKSHFMSQVLKKCRDLNLPAELYYCSFDPTSIDMLIIRDLDYCLFDSTDPHEFNPEHTGDQVIDLYELAVDRDTDERYAKEIKEITEMYRSRFKKGIQTLAAIQELDNLEAELVKKYSPQLEHDIVSQLLLTI